jgi:hypothetical protein
MSAWESDDPDARGSRPRSRGKHAEHAHELSLISMGKELRVDPFDDPDRPASESGTFAGRSYGLRAAVGSVDRSRHETARLEFPDDLRRHLHIGTRLLGDPELVRRLALSAQPPRAGKDHELRVRELER